MASDDTYTSSPARRSGTRQGRPEGAGSRGSEAPFGAGCEPSGASAKRSGSGGGGSKGGSQGGSQGSSQGGQKGGSQGGRMDWRKPSKRRGSARRGGRKRKRGSEDGPAEGARPAEAPQAGGGAGPATAAPRPDSNGAPAASTPAQAPQRQERWKSPKPGRPGKGPKGPAPKGKGPKPGKPPFAGKAPFPGKGPGKGGALGEAEGMFVLEKGGFGVLRREEKQFVQSREDVFVPTALVQRFRLRDGALVRGRVGKGQKHKYALLEVQTVDGRAPAEVADAPAFKDLVTIDPDFHYAVGDVTANVSMRILDLICPVGRGQRGLIVAPPRAGKTTILRQFAQGISDGYPEVHLVVLLVDERPEEATEWRRSTKGQVFVSTSDETPKTHVQLAEAVWRRCTRLVELGEDVVLLLDSITRLARAYNNVSAGSGRTMSGGLDSRAMERPRQIFGSARNTEKAGSLTILGTTLIETGSRMDQLIFEEFKGTGNMELVLSRKLADRRIFPAIDLQRSGTRKEEKLISSKRLKQITTLRRVLNRMSFIEAMELLATKLEEVETNDDFLKRFEVDPEA